MENVNPETNESSTSLDPFVPDVIKSRKYVTIEPLVFGIFLAECLTEALTVNLIVSRTCEIHFGFNKSVCDALGNKSINDSDIVALVQTYSAVIITSKTFLSVFLPAIMSLFLGSWSDHNGRKLVLILPAWGNFLKFIILGIFSLFPNVSPGLLLLCVLPVSLSGGLVNFVFASYTYISDITKEDNRSVRIGILESCMTAGCVIGLLIAAPVYSAGGDYGFLAVYGLGACVVLSVTVPTCIFVPDSIQRTEGGKGIAHIFEAKYFKEMFKVCFKKRGECRRAVIFLTMISLTLTICIMVGEENVMYLFIRLQLGWNIQKYTVWSSMTLALNFIGLLLGILLFMKWLKLPDPITCVISYTLKCATSLYIAFLPKDKPLLMYFVGVLNIFGGLCGPAARTILSSSVPKEDLGKVFGLLSSSEAIFPLIVGPLYTAVYNATIEILPNAFLLLSSSIFFICCLFFIITYFIHKPVEPDGM